MANESGKKKALKRFDWFESISYIASNIKEEICLNDLVDYTGINRVTLINSFKKQCGCTPINFIWSIRSIIGVQLINQYHYESIGSIAVFLGFKSQEHFSRKIKQVFSNSPKYFKKREAIQEIEEITGKLLLKVGGFYRKESKIYSARERQQYGQKLGELLAVLIDQTSSEFYQTIRTRKAFDHFSTDSESKNPPPFALPRPRSKNSNFFMTQK